MSTHDHRIIYVARHGETDWNRAQRWQGHTDVALNEAGRAQALLLAERLRGRGVTRVHASDLGRARETAEIVAARLGAVFLGADARLRERSFGVFEGLTRKECEEQHAEHWARYRLDPRNKPPGAEAHEEVIARMLAGVYAVASARGPEEVALVVSHGGAIRALVSAVTGVACPPVGNTAVFRLLVRTGASAQEPPGPASFRAAEELP